jgi:hypothetical protein
VHVDAGRDELGGHLVRARARVLVHELARVRDQADVERLGHLDGGLEVERPHQVPDDLGRARRLGHDEVDRAEVGVVVMVVDVDDPRARALERVGGVAVDVPAVQEDDRAVPEVGRGLGDQAVELDEPVLVGQRELVGGHEHQRVLAQPAQQAVHADERAERVAVGVLVRGEQEAVVAADGREHLIAGGRLAVDPRYSEHGHASSSLSSSEMRRLRSRESS